MLASVLAIALSSGLLFAQQLKTLSFDQVFKNAEPRVTTPLPAIPAWLDDRHYLLSKRTPGEERPRQVAVDAESGVESPYRDLQQYKDLLPQDADANAPTATAAATARFSHRRRVNCGGAVAPRDGSGPCAGRIVLSLIPEL